MNASGGGKNTICYTKPLVLVVKMTCMMMACFGMDTMFFCSASLPQQIPDAGARSQLNLPRDTIIIIPVKNSQRAAVVAHLVSRTGKGGV
jgi:hypothetical protein